MADRVAIERQVRELIFRLDWEVDGKASHGTGFFISSSGLALTAYHNAAVLFENRQRVLYGKFGQERVPFALALANEADAAWQKAIGIAVLQSKSVRPPEIKPLPLRYFDLAVERPERAQFWGTRPVLASGFPCGNEDSGFAAWGDVDGRQPLQGPSSGEECDRGLGLLTVCIGTQLGDDLPGMSGSPVYDEGMGAIVGVVCLGRSSRGCVYAVELHHLADRWKTFAEMAESFVPPRPHARFAFAVSLAVAIAAGTIAVVGSRLPDRPVVVNAAPALAKPVQTEIAMRAAVLRYRGAAGKGEKIFVQQTSPADWEWLAPGTVFWPGERVRFSVEISRPGFLYVVDREQYADGSLGPPYLIFPTGRMRAGDNAVEAGKRFEFPAVTDSPAYLTLETGHQQWGELLDILLLEDRLDLPLGSQPLRLTAEQFTALAGATARESGVKLFVQPQGAKALAVMALPLRVHQ